jgi:hypothetical protein
MVAADTIDDFVQSVLERKGALINAVVDGKAIAPDLSGDVLDELQRALRTISSEAVKAPQAGEEDDLIERLLRQARLNIETSQSSGAPFDSAQGRPARTPEELEAFRRALAALAKALTVPPIERYRFASTSHPDVEYELTIDGADVICNCPGFEYRGQCRHARDLKAALAAGRSVPQGYRSAVGRQS